MEAHNGQTTQLMVPFEPGFLDSGATEEQVWRHFYRLANIFAKYQDVQRSLLCMVDVFLIRGKELHNSDKDWLDFFRRQFSMYLLGKKRICCSLSEGDMIHDLLKMEYERIKQELSESEIAFHHECLLQWFNSIEIDFPWCVDPFESIWSVG